MMLGLLLARAGVGVQVLEKHADFLRDFRGDTIHPSTLEVMHELGLLDERRRARRGVTKPAKTIARIVPFAADRMNELASWGQVKLLTVQIDRLKRWYARGVLCIGDAAHAMSPVGGVGINIAIQDAVAAANILAAPLLEGALSIAHLERVQRRREWPVRLTQRLQMPGRLIGMGVRPEHVRTSAAAPGRAPPGTTG